MSWPLNGRNSISTEQSPGVIETLGNGYVLLNKQPYLLVPPIILDLLLWLGYRLSLRPLTDEVLRWFGSPSTLDSGTIDRIRSAGSSFNLFELLAVSTPTFVTRIGANAVSGSTTQTIGSFSWWALLPISLALLILGVTIGVFYLTLLGYLVRGERVALGSVLRTSWTNTLHTFGYLLLVLGIVVLIMFPVMMLSGILLAFGISIVALTALFVFFGAIWAYLLLYFARDAIIISQAGPARAIYLSYNVVRANFWPCIGLIVATMIIQFGAPLALVVFTRTTMGVPLAFVIHSYVLTGLAVAAMLFYRDRAIKLRSVRESAAPDRTS